MISKLNQQSSFSARRSDAGSALWLLFTATLIILGLWTLVFFVFGKIVPPNTIGVRKNYFSIWPLERGIKSVGLPPGLHWKVPGISDIILLPRDFQIVSFQTVKEAAEFERDPLEVPTRDGSRVRTDISMLLRFCDEPGPRCSSVQTTTETAHRKKTDRTEPIGDDSISVPLTAEIATVYGGPRDLLTSYTAEDEKRFATFAIVAENALKTTLSDLTTTDYYNPEKRELAAVTANDQINRLVNRSGIQLWGTLIRRYSYVERSIDDQIFNKNLQDQTERLKAAASRLSAAKAKTEEQSAIGDAKIRDLEIQTEARANVLQSEAALYEAKKQAEGDLMVASSRAAIDSERATALSSVAGSEVYVAREMTPLLETLSGGVVSGIDPFDVSRWVEKLAPKGDR